MLECAGCGAELTGRQKKWCSSDCQKKENRRIHIWKCFNITLEEYDTILHAQGNGCGICGKAPTRGKSLAVDHDHHSGVVRGLLCFFCNRRILGARSAGVLVKTAEYVVNPPAVAALGREVIAPGRPKKKRRTVRRKRRGRTT